MSALARLSADVVRELLDYDAATGQFTFRRRGLHWFKSQRACNAWNARFEGRPTGTDNGAGYTSLRLLGMSYKAHRVAWMWVFGKQPDGEIDHVNQDPSDNRIENLRVASRAANQQNQRRAQRSNRSTGLLGAYRDKATGRFRAAIRHNGKSLYLGQFDTAPEAHAAYVEAKRKLHEGCTL